MCCCDKEGLLDRLCESPVVVAVCAAVPKICANDGAWCNPPLLLVAAAGTPSSTICETSSLPPAPGTTFASCINSVSSANVCAPSAVSVPPGVVSVRKTTRGEKSKTSVLLCGQRKEKRLEKKRHHHHHHHHQNHRETIANTHEIIE